MENSLASKTITGLTLVLAYKFASEFKPHVNAQLSRLKAVFNVRAGETKKPDNHNSSNVKCWGCGKVGHTLRACLRAKTAKGVNMTTRMTRSTTRSMTNRTLGTDHVVLDNGANVSIFRPEHLLNIKPLTEPTVSSAFQGSVLTCYACGDLPGFFPVEMSTVIPQNILSFSVPKKLKVAHDLIRNAGYPSMPVAHDLFFNGNNVSGLPIDRNDLEQAMNVLGPHVGYTRGRAKWRDATVRAEKVEVMKATQELFTDIADVEGDKYLISVAKPIVLILSTPLSDQYRETIGAALQSHIDKLAAYGFRISTIHADNEFRPQELAFPRVKWEICGAGDHSKLKLQSEA